MREHCASMVTRNVVNKVHDEDEVTCLEGGGRGRHDGITEMSIRAEVHRPSIHWIKLLRCGRLVVCLYEEYLDSCKWHSIGTLRDAFKRYINMYRLSYHNCINLHTKMYGLLSRGTL